MRAKRSLGQNFLRDEAVVSRIVDALEIKRGDRVVEIGPGSGALTGLLVKRASSVIGIEFDRDLAAQLEQQFKSFRGFELINEDILSMDLTRIAAALASVKVVGNLPYNISTPILQRLIECKDAFATLVLMFQREVVDRLTAAPGNRNRGFLTVLTENAFDVERLFDVPPQSFYPIPKVWSSVIRLTPKADSPIDDGRFRRIVSTAFGKKRKTILNNLRSEINEAETVLKRAKIDPMRRAETLDLSEWRELTRAIGQ